MVSMTRIPLAWLLKDTNNDLVIVDFAHMRITELQDNVFKQLTRHIEMVVLHTSISIIEPAAFAGLEGIKCLSFRR